jgi:hypothetical protein
MKSGAIQGLGKPNRPAIAKEAKQFLFEPSRFWDCRVKTVKKNEGLAPLIDLSRSVFC